MSTMYHHSGKTLSIPKGLTISSLISILITVFLSFIIAYTLDKEMITWNQAGYWIMGMLFIASYIDGKCAYLLIKQQRFGVAVMSGILYWGILLCITALFFGGRFGSLWETAGIILAGSCTSALLFLPNQKKRPIKKRSPTVKLNKKSW